MAGPASGDGTGVEVATRDSGSKSSESSATIIYWNVSYKHTETNKDARSPLVLSILSVRF